MPVVRGDAATVSLHDPARDGQTHAEHAGGVAAHGGARVRQAVDAVGDGGNPAVATVLALALGCVAVPGSSPSYQVAEVSRIGPLIQARLDMMVPARSGAISSSNCAAVLLCSYSHIHHQLSGT